MDQQEPKQQRWMLQKRLGVLIAIFALLAVATGMLLPTDPLIAARLQAIMHPSPPMVYENFNPDDAAKLDPKYGSYLPITGAGKALRTLPASDHGYVIVALGNCAQCMHFDFKKWETEAHALHVPIVGVSGATQKNLDEYRKDVHVTMPIQFDLMNRLQASLNAYWSGRVYYFDSSWKLQWKMDGFGNPGDLYNQPSLKELIEGDGK